MTIPTEDKRITLLALKWKNGTIKAKEKEEFETWYASFDDNELEELSNETVDQLRRRLYQSILTKERIAPIKNRSLHWKYVAAAAAILIVIGVSLFFNAKNPVQTIVQNHINEIIPGRNNATLTLANGTKISLSDAKNGTLALQNDVQVQKNTDGQIVYDLLHNEVEATNDFNAMTTPRGGQYQVVLSDGTKVFLNAGSSLRYPVRFSGATRKIELVGEAYFEVSKDKHHPFIVVTNEQEVEVLGTHFNINSYADEPQVRTSLLEGSVKVSSVKTSKSKLLKPGQQAIMSDGQLSVINTDVDMAVAWKDGYFMFNSEPIESIMRKISRWYDVEVIYSGKVPTDDFGGTVKRGSDIKSVLRKLELTGKIHFKIDGRRIIVSP
jgi:transmembrane sensor